MTMISSSSTPSQAQTVTRDADGRPTRPCPVCGSERSRFYIDAPPHLLDDVDRIPDEVYAYRKCDDCRAVFIAELPSAETLSIYYDSADYHRYKRKLTGSRPDRLSPVWYAYLSVLRPIPAKPPGKHLDFGCGAGDYVVFGRSQGWDSAGIEFSEASAAEGRDRGLTVYTEAQLDAIPDGSVDLVTMNHSLEHVFDPVATLRTMAAKVRRGGMVYVEVPSLDCPDFWLFGGSFLGAPLHTQFFDDGNMRLLGDRVGLRLEGCRNNPWMIQYFTLTFLTWLQHRFGLRLKGSTAGLISAAMFPIMVFPALLLPVVGINGMARRYYFRKPVAAEAGSGTTGRQS